MRAAAGAQPLRSLTYRRRLRGAGPRLRSLARWLPRRHHGRLGRRIAAARRWPRQRPRGVDPVDGRVLDSSRRCRGLAPARCGRRRRSEVPLLLEGRRALVTGAASGIGKATALRLGARGGLGLRQLLLRHGAVPTPRRCAQQIDGSGRGPSPPGGRRRRGAGRRHGRGGRRALRRHRRAGQQRRDREGGRHPGDAAGRCGTRCCAPTSPAPSSACARRADRWRPQAGSSST